MGACLAKRHGECCVMCDGGCGDVCCGGKLVSVRLYGLHHMYTHNTSLHRNTFYNKGRISTRTDRERVVLHHDIYHVSCRPSIYFFDMVWEIFDMAGRDF